MSIDPMWVKELALTCRGIEANAFAMGAVAVRAHVAAPEGEVPGEA